MQRVAVVGPSGSGKTTLASELALKLGLPHIELDSLWWDPGWQAVGPAVMQGRTRAAVAADRWIVDGNYYSHVARDIIWPRADTIIWLDFPRLVTMGRIVRRTLRRSVRRVELWNGNREHLGTVFRRDELLRFAWREYPKYARRYSQIATTPAFAHVTVTRLGSAHDVRGYLAATAAATAAAEE